MIRVTVDVVRHGDERQTSTLGTLTISNIGPTDAVEAIDPEGDRAYLVELDRPGQPISVTEIVHARGDGWLPLVERALDAMF